MHIPVILELGLRIALIFAADTTFVLASRPPHRAETSEIQRDNQALVDFAISNVHRVAGPLIHLLTTTQLWFTLRSGRDGRPGIRLGWNMDAWDIWEVVGYLGMILGGQLRLWCYRVLGRFFTFNVSTSTALRDPSSASVGCALIIYF